MYPELTAVFFTTSTIWELVCIYNYDTQIMKTQAFDCLITYTSLLKYDIILL